MTRRCHTHKLHTNPRHQEEESQEEESKIGNQPHKLCDLQEDTTLTTEP